MGRLLGFECSSYGLDCLIQPNKIGTLVIEPGLSRENHVFRGNVASLAHA